MQPPETRPSLIIRLTGKQNELAWWEFVAAYEPFLRWMVERRGVPSQHVPDVCQQVLLALARSVEQWQPDGQPASFRRWLNRVARNTVIKFLSKERRQPVSLGGTDFLQQLDAVTGPVRQSDQQAYEFELITWAAEQVRSEFRETSWRAFWETAIGQRPVDEVSQELNVSPGSIYMSRSRVMARIRTKIQQIDQPE